VQLVKTLFATPLRIDPRTGDIAPGLCSSWRPTGTQWTFRCRDAARVARAIPTGAITVEGHLVHVRLPFRWLRFPYLLTSAQSAVPGVAGPFRVVSGRTGEIVARRRGLTVRFEQVEPHRAAVLFRHGELDEAPVPLGDIRAAELDRQVQRAVRVTRLLAVDTVLLDTDRGALAGLPNTRGAYAATLDRGDYRALVPEYEADAATSLVPGYAPNRVRPKDFRAARARVPSLPPVAVGIGADPETQYGRDLLVAVWRDVGLKASVGGSDGRLVRVLAPYPQDEALQVSLYLRGERCGTAALVRALGAVDQRDDLERAADVCYAAGVLPVSWVADARFVSPRVRGWREDRLGVVDYSRIRLRASTRRP
jgi:hypothetical protein